MPSRSDAFSGTPRPAKLCEITCTCPAAYSLDEPDVADEELELGDIEDRDLGWSEDGVGVAIEDQLGPADLLEPIVGVGAEGNRRGLDRSPGVALGDEPDDAVTGVHAHGLEYELVQPLGQRPGAERRQRVGG